jgi:hypothetical protein
MSHHLLLIDIRHCIELSRCCGCGWHLKMLLESGDRRCPLLKLEVLLLNVGLEVYDRVPLCARPTPHERHLAAGRSSATRARPR